MKYGSIGYKQLNGFLEEYESQKVERSQCLSIMVHFLTADLNVECIISSSKAICPCKYVQV
jgi:hypothetical protein